MDEVQERKEYSTPGSIANRGNLLSRSGSGLTLIVVLVVLVLGFGFSTRHFFSFSNYKAIASEIPIFAVMSVGMTFVILIAGLDLSVGSVLGLSVICAVLFSNIGFPAWAVVLLGVAIGSFLGLVNGLIITKIGVNPVVTTLGMMSAARGLDSWFALKLPQLKVGRIYDQHLLNFGRLYLTKSTAIVPYALLYVLALYLVATYVLYYTRFGRDVYAVGSNPYAAKLAGINVDRTRLLAYLISGATAGFAGMILLAQLGMGRDDAGTGTELQVITVCLLGGVSLAGGRGNLLGVIVAVLIITVIQNGMVQLQSVYGISYFWDQVAQGLVLIGAITVDRYRQAARQKAVRVRQ